ncbi:MAG: hypothetical protein ACR2JP_10915 [Acidimicrobiia bacterium]
MRNLLLIIHILSVGVWLGASVTQLVVGPRLTRQSSEVAAAWMTASMNLARKLYPVAGVLVLLTGIWLVLQSEVYGFADVFVTVGLVAVIVGGVLGGPVFAPAAEKAAKAFGAGDTAAGSAAMVRIARFGLLDVVLLVVAVAAMVMKWGV